MRTYACVIDVQKTTTAGDRLSDLMSGEISVKNSVDYLSETRAKLEVAVSAADFRPAYEKAAKKVAKQVNIPGFRPGKAPRRVLESRIGKGYIIEQAINDSLDSYYRDAAAEFGISPMSRPEVAIDEVPEMKGAEDSTALKFTVEVDIRPEISLPDPGAVKIEVPAGEVTDDEVETALTDLRERFATLTDVNRKAKKGDYVNIDLVATIDGKQVDDMSGVSYRIGDGNMLEGQDAALTGAKSGDVVEFTSKLAGGEHKGEEAAVTVTVHSVKESVLPDADDEFAQLASEFDTIGLLRDDLRKNAAKSKVDGQIFEAEQKLIEELLELAEFPLPQSVVDEEVAAHLEQEGKSEDKDHAEEARKDVEKQLRLQLLLDAYAEGFGVEVGREDLLNFLMQQAKMYGMDPNQFIQAAAQSNQLPAFAGELARNKAVIAAMRLAKVVDDKGNEVDVVSALGEAPENEKVPEFNLPKTRKINPAAKKAKPAAKAGKTARAGEPQKAEKPVKAAKGKKAAAAQSADTPAAPAKSALKGEWVAYRVATGELTEAEAKKMTKDALINYQG